MSQELLVAIVTAAGPEIASDFSTAYRSSDPSNSAVAQYIDALLCELQETGLLEADDNTSSRSWREAVEAAFGDEEDE